LDLPTEGTHIETGVVSVFSILQEFIVRV